MMIKLLVFLGLVGVGHGLVCAPVLCQGAKFDAAQCKGGVIKNGGFCGCTDACAKVEGESCQATSAFLSGNIPAGTCDQDLTCVASGFNLLGRGVCQKHVQKRSTQTACERKRLQSMIIMVVYRGQWTPRCDSEGNFVPKQCDNTGACFCVDKTTGAKLTASVKC